MAADRQQIWYQWFERVDDPRAKIHGLRVSYAFTVGSKPAAISCAVARYLEYQFYWNLFTDSFAEMEAAAARFLKAEDIAELAAW